MSSKAMSLKARINKYAKSNDIAAQVVLQNYMFERFLARLSVSNYNEKFIIKGGMLIAAIVGLDTRSTMDLDATLRNLLLTEDKIIEMVKNICSIDLSDDVLFEVLAISPIRKDDQYGGFCVRLNAKYDLILTPLSIDISTGDVITPSAIQYEFGGIFDETLKIKLWGYNIETVMAEKIETILSRGIFNTRPRDYYDVYILTTTQKYDKDLFHRAFLATSEHRGSEEKLVHIEPIIKQIAESVGLQESWLKYQKKFPYAKDITYDEIIKVIQELMKMDTDIKRAEERLDYLSSDEKEIELYKAREKSLHERANMINGAREEGRAEGRKEGIIEKENELVKNCLNQGLSLDMICKITGKSIDEIDKIKKLLN